MSQNSHIFAMPIVRVEMNSATAAADNTGDTGAGAVLHKHHILSESNIIIEPIVQKNDLGGEIAAGYRSLITIYTILHESGDERVQQFKKMAKWKRASAKIFFGGADCGFNQPPSKKTQLTYNESLAVSFQTETVPGFIRYVIKLSGITKDFPQISFTH